MIFTLKTGQPVEPDRSNKLSLYNALMELCKEKNHVFQTDHRSRIVPAKLSQGIEWYVYFYIKDPVTQKMRRVCITITQKQLRTRPIL